VFQAILGDYPELPEPHNNLAVLYAQKGEYELARGELEAAISAAPDYAVAYENLGDVYARLAALNYERRWPATRGTRPRRPSSSSRATCWRRRRQYPPLRSRQPRRHPRRPPRPLRPHPTTLPPATAAPAAAPPAAAN